jgi:hypothetical protein
VLHHFLVFPFSLVAFAACILYSTSVSLVVDPLFFLFRVFRSFLLLSSLHPLRGVPITYGVFYYVWLAEQSLHAFLLFGVFSFRRYSFGTSVDNVPPFLLISRICSMENT